MALMVTQIRTSELARHAQQTTANKSNRKSTYAHMLARSKRKCDSFWAIVLLPRIITANIGGCHKLLQRSLRRRGQCGASANHRHQRGRPAGHRQHKPGQPSPHDELRRRASTADSEFRDRDAGTTALGNALGLNGPAGTQSALTALETTPGYQTSIGAGNAGVNAAGRSCTSRRRSMALNHDSGQLLDLKRVPPQPLRDATQPQPLPKLPSRDR
jgi:hypothetical protein